MKLAVPLRATSNETIYAASHMNTA